MRPLSINIKYVYTATALLLAMALIALFIPAVVSDSPPSTIWNKTVHESVETIAPYDFDICSDNGLVLVGSFTENANASNSGPVILRLNSTGDFQWKTVLVDEDFYFSDVKVLEDGSFLVAGTLDLGPGQPLGLWKFDSDGDLAWNRTYAASATGAEIKVLADGYMLAVSTGYTLPGVNPIVIKVDEDGNFQWNKTMAAPMAGTYVMSVSYDGGFVVQGYSGNYQSISKLDSDFNATFTKLFDLPGMYVLTGGIANGNTWMLYIVSPGYAPTPYDNMTFFALLDNAGNVLVNQSVTWDSRPTITSLWQTSDGGFLASGTLGLFPNIVGLIAKLDAAGELVWEKRITEPYETFQIVKVAPATDGYFGMGRKTTSTLYVIKLAGAEGPPAKQDASLTLACSKTNATVSEDFTLSGSLSPARSGTVTLRWSINGSSFIYTRNVTMTNGQYSTSFGASAPGTWAFKATWTGDAEYNPAESNTVSVSVTPPPPETTNVTFALAGTMDYTGNVLTVDGTGYPASQLPKTFTWDVSSVHSYAWASPLSSSTTTYTWSSASGLSASQSGTVTAVGGGGSVTATYSGSPISPPKSGCFIATATYGSEAAPQVQALRDFRDGIAMKTFAGSNFMTGFLTWYYSWSPPVAYSISPNDDARAVMRVALQPILNILQVATVTFLALSFNGELAIVAAGFVAAALIGLVYMTPAVALGLIGLKRLRKGTALPGVSRVLHLTAIPWVASIALMALAELLVAPSLMVAATMAFVALTIVLVVSTTSLWLAGLFRRG